MAPDADMPQPMVPPRQQRWWPSVLLGLVILICGGIIGAGVTAHVLWDRFVYHARDPEHLPLRIVEHMTDNLDLTPEQVKRIRDVVATHHAALGEIHQDLRPRIHGELELMRAEVESVLTAEQAEEWNDHMDELRHRWFRPGPPKGRRGFGPRPGGRRGEDGP